MHVIHFRIYCDFLENGIKIIIVNYIEVISRSRGNQGRDGGLAHIPEELP